MSKLTLSKALFCIVLLAAAAFAPAFALPRVECTSDGPMTTCCGPCGCCTWTGDGNGPRCVSNC